MILEDKLIGGNLSSGGVLRIFGNSGMGIRVGVNLIVGKYREEKGDSEWCWGRIYWTIIGGAVAVRSY
jgi:ABC-type transporter Mla maintaining outer membrane lipid asymmetry ATPase subunit MlaF